MASSGSNQSQRSDDALRVTVETLRSSLGHRAGSEAPSWRTYRALDSANDSWPTQVPRPKGFTTEPTVFPSSSGEKEATKVRNNSNPRKLVYDRFEMAAQDDPDVDFQLTYIVVGKRHNTRKVDQ